MPARPRPYQPVPAWITQLVGFTDDRTGRPRALVTSYAGARVVLDLLDGHLVGAVDERAHANVCATARIGGERMIVSGGGAGYLQVSDLGAGRSRWRQWCGVVRSLATVTLAGRPLAVVAGGSPQLQVWSLDVERGERLATLRVGEERIAVLAAAEVGGTAVVAAGTSAGQVRLWRLTADPDAGGDVRAEPLGEHGFDVPGLVGALEFADWRGRPILLGSAGRLVRAWDVATGMPLGPAFTGHAGQVNSVIAGRLGNRPVLWSGDDSTVRGWLPETGEQVGEPFRYPFEAAMMRTVGVQIEGRPMLATGDGAGVVWVWDPERPYPFDRGVRPGRVRAASPGTGTDCPIRLAVTEFAGRLVVIAGFADQAVRAFDLVDGAEVEVPLDGVQGAAVLVPGEHPLVARTGGDRIELWDPTTGDRLGSAVPRPEGEPGVLASGLVDGRRTLLLTVGADLFCVDVATGRWAGPLAGHSGRIHGVTATEVSGVPVALTASEDDTVRLWNLRSGRIIRTVLDNHGGGAYAVTTATLDGRCLAFSAGQNGQVWGVDLTGLTAGPVRPAGPEPRVLLQAGGPVRSIAVTRAGGTTWLVAADRVTLLWRPIGEVTAPSQTVDLSGAVTDLAAVHDTVVVAAEDGLIGYRPPVADGSVAGRPPIAG